MREICGGKSNIFDNILNLHKKIGKASEIISLFGYFYRQKIKAYSNHILSPLNNCHQQYRFYAGEYYQICDMTTYIYKQIEF